MIIKKDIPNNFRSSLINLNNTEGFLNSDLDAISKNGIKGRLIRLYRILFNPTSYRTDLVAKKLFEYCEMNGPLEKYDISLALGVLLKFKGSKHKDIIAIYENKIRNLAKNPSKEEIEPIQLNGINPILECAKQLQQQKNPIPLGKNVEEEAPKNKKKLPGQVLVFPPDAILPKVKSPPAIPARPDQGPAALKHR
jgi:hypothetical protein